MYADVVGYSRLIAADDNGTLKRLRHLRRELLDPLSAEQGGRIVQTAGDSWLLVFDSIDGALNCAIALQRRLRASPLNGPDNPEIRLRIAINAGDAIPDGGDLHGDGVNVAVRLQEACPAGSVCVTRFVRDQMQDRCDLAFASLGELQLKNIAHPVEAFVLRPNPEPPAARRPRSIAWRRLALPVNVAAAAAVVSAWAMWWCLDHAPRPGGTAEAALSSAGRPLLPAAYSPQDRRQSVIVLPFENSSGDPGQDGIAAALSRDITDIIADDTAVPLVPAATASAYKGKALDLRTIGREHEVHFAMVGNARRQDGRLLAAVTLYDVAAPQPVWSRRFDVADGKPEWNAVIEDIDQNFEQATMDAEVARAQREHPDILDKRDLMFAANRSALQSTSKEHYLQRLSLIGRALQLDQDYVWALGQDAKMHTVLVLDGFSADPDADLAIAARDIDRALVLAPDNSSVLFVKLKLLRAQDNFDGAAVLAKQLVQRDPFYSDAHRDLGSTMMALGKYQEALASYMTAQQLRPPFGVVALLDSYIAIALQANCRLVEAIAQARLAIAEFSPESGSDSEFAWLALIAAESAGGQEAEARSDLQRFLAKKPIFGSIAEVSKIRLVAADASLLEGLRRAGMPEH